MISERKMRYSIFSVQDHHPGKSRTVQELYQQVMRQGVLADELGYDAFFVAEHHFHEYGAVPNPAIFLAALAQRTERIKLGPAISILTFHQPLTVAENYAMVDLLSSGRLIMGVGSGYLKHEFEGYRIDPEEKRGRFDEHLHILKQALEGKRVSYQGRFTSVDNVQLNVSPMQKQVPMYVAVLRKEAAYHVGRQGNNIICVPYASVNVLDEVTDLVKDHTRGFEESGAKHQPGALFAFHAHVSETDEQARKNAEEAFDLYVDTRLYAKRQTYDDILQSGLGLFGSVETVANKLLVLYEMGVRHVLLLQNFGMLDPILVHDSMRLFAEKVMPLVERNLIRKAYI
jgi:alkanesulfonate monooxygenase SsuD/methylene tetrahydromethanopterin reductase-like flavin-dependent oxidoreductase (luciferase family)